MRHWKVVLIALVVAVPAMAQSGVKPDHSSIDISRSFGTTAHEWTAEEMRSAIPADLPGVPEREMDRWDAEANGAGALYDVTGGPGFEAGGLPLHARDWPSRRAIADDEEAAPPVPPVADAFSARRNVATNGAPTDVRSLGYIYPPPYNRYETFPTYTDYPHLAVGKVFFRNAAGTAFVCSASSIGGDAVITAAHCVRDGKTGAWWSSWTFVPAYKNGAAPYGQWTANHLWTRGGWVNGASGDFRYDVGGAVLNRRSGYKLSQMVGWLGFQWSTSSLDTGAHWAVIGYPQGPPFNGQYQFICQTSFAYNGSIGSPSSIGVGCDLTGGCSGGPWLRKYSKTAGAANYVNGVNSYRRCYDAACTSTYVHEMFTSYFDANVKALKDCLVNSVPGNPADPAKSCAPGT